MPKPTGQRHLSDQAIDLIAAQFKILSEPARLKLLVALESGEKNVTQLVEACRANQANVSRHLKTLAASGLVRRRKEGVTVYYSIADQAIFDLCECVCGSLQERLQAQGQASKWFRGFRDI